MDFWATTQLELRPNIMPIKMDTNYKIHISHRFSMPWQRKVFWTEIVEKLSLKYLKNHKSIYTEWWHSSRKNSYLQDSWRYGVYYTTNKKHTTQQKTHTMKYGWVAFSVKFRTKIWTTKNSTQIRKHSSLKWQGTS